MLKWKNFDRTVILASQSPRRQEILQVLGITFQVQKPELDDEKSYINAAKLEQSISNLAFVKAHSISCTFPSALIFGGDTVVVGNNRILGKPKDYEEAKTMLQFLSGRMHKVYSGVALICEELGFQLSDTGSTEVYFRKLESWEIEEYLETEEYTDKAGAYAIQGRAMAFIDRINGCFYNVMGLPISKTIHLCQEYFNFVKGLK